MRPTARLLGASRLPLTTKRGNKDYYKGTRQAYVPGAGHRTGPPGAHVIRGKAKYRIKDEAVRFYVGPGIEKIEESKLKPYVEMGSGTVTMRLPSFSPNAQRVDGRRPTESDARAFSKAYAQLDTDEKAALVQQSRREWYTAMSRRFAAPEPAPATNAEAKPEESKA